MPSEYDALPYRYLHMVYGGNDPHDGIVYANFDVPDQLRYHLDQIRTESKPSSSIHFAEASTRIYLHLREAQKIFDALKDEKVPSSEKIETLDMCLDSPLLGA
jgi:hypothetical protein